MSSDPPGSASLLVLLMRVSGQTLAIRQREVAEILPLPRLVLLPEAPPVVIGAFLLGGALVLALRMASVLGLAPRNDSSAAEGNPLYHHLLLLAERQGRARLAFLVDRATDIVLADTALLPPGESFNDCVDGDIRLNGTLVPLLSAERLLTAHESARVAAFATRAAVRDAAFAPAGLP